MLRMTCLLLLIVFKAYYADAVETSMTIMEMIRSYGYPAEQHKKIKTKDGYLLTMHRIPYGIHNTERENRPVVFLMHGLLSSSIDWVNIGPGVSIAYDLVEAGYDVWMGNARGNKLSRAHQHLNPLLNSKRFWAFSWHEIGYYDLPAMIDFVLKRTEQKKLSYIGHSQGTTVFFVMASMRPKYNKKIKLMVALAPVVFMNNLWNPFLQLLSQFHHHVRYTATLIGWNEFIPAEKLLNMIGKRLCASTSKMKSKCASVFFLIGGWDSEQFNKSTVPLIVANAPAGASTRQMIHYAQGVQTGKFRQYDFGEFMNLVKYQNPEPPKYPLKKVSAPISLVYADNDWLSATVDVTRLHTKLCSVVDMYNVPFKKFNHFDFLFAIDLKKLVTNHVVDTLNKYVE